MKRRFSMALPLIFAFILTLLPFGLLEYNQFQRNLIRQERELALWEQKAGNYLQLFRSLWSYEAQIRRRMFLLHKHVKETGAEEQYNAQRFLKDLSSFFPQKHLPVAVFAGLVNSTGQSVEMFSGEGYSAVKQRVFKRILTGLARTDVIPSSEVKSLNSMVRGAFGENLDFELLKNHRRGKISRAIFSGEMRLVYWDSLLTPAGQRVIYLHLYAQNAVNRLESMQLAAGILSTSNPQVCSVLMPLEFADPALQPVFDPFVPPEQRAMVKQIFQKMQNHELKRNQKFPFGEFFEVGGKRTLRDFIDYAVPYEIWIMSRSDMNSQQKEPFIGFLMRLFFFSAWILVFTRVMVTGRPIGISLKTWLTLIFLVVGILPLAVFFVAGVFHIDSAAYRREQEAIKDVLQQLEEADSSGETLLAEYRDFCQSMDNDKSWNSLLNEWNEKSWEKAWQELPGKFSLAGLHIDAMYVYPPDVASLPSRCFISDSNDVDPEREKRNFEFYSSWIRRAYFGLVPEVMSGMVPELPVFKGRTADAIMRYFLSNRGDIEFLDLENEKFFLFQNYLLKEGIPHNWYFIRVNILRDFEKYLRQSVENLQGIFADNIYSIAVMQESQAKIIFPQKSGKNLSVLEKVAGRWIDLAAITRTRIIEQTADYLVVTYPCVKSGPFVLTGIVFFSGFRAQAYYQEIILSIIVVLMIIPVLLISRFTAAYLVSPLIGVESGLKKIADEDFSIKLKLNREDELGKLTSAFDRMVEGLKERRNLGKFVSATLDEQVARDDRAENYGLEKRFGAILCSDIRGFTTLSENNPVRDIVAMLNDHLAAISSCITENDGLVEQYIGDAVLAVFHGSSQAEAAEKALKAAEEIMRTHLLLNRQRQSDGKFGYEIGVGIEVGRLLSGIIKAGARREYAVVGAVRSRAEKLEAKSKLGRYSRIVVSPTFYELISGKKFARLSDDENYELVTSGGES